MKIIPIFNLILIMFLLHATVTMKRDLRLTDELIIVTADVLRKTNEAVFFMIEKIIGKTIN